MVVNCGWLLLLLLLLLLRLRILIQYPSSIARCLMTLHAVGLLQEQHYMYASTCQFLFWEHRDLDNRDGIR